MISPGLKAGSIKAIDCRLIWASSACCFCCRREASNLLFLTGDMLSLNSGIGASLLVISFNFDTCALFYVL
jgi:hypothetical protein